MYEYAPITDDDGIRLIVLHASPDKAAAIQCEIIHTTLRQAEVDIYDHYTALSYVWGDKQDKITISVNGEPLRITSSLECALRHLRDATRTLRVWADGVCINQLDDTERGKQVQQMGMVYKTATHMVIFLGEGDQLMEAAISYIISQRGSRLSATEDCIKAVDQLLLCPWFYRVWIFQELVLSSTPQIQYGLSRILWSVLCEAAMAVKNLAIHMTFYEPDFPGITPWSLSLEQRIKTLEQMDEAKCSVAQQTLQKSHPTKSKNSNSSLDEEQSDRIAKHLETFDAFIHNLGARRGFGVSDPRDMIYAHLGLVDHLDLEIRYEAPVAKVFQDLAQRHILNTGSIEIFAHLEDIELERRRTGLVTWAPDWTIRQASSRHQSVIHEDVPLNYHSDPDLHTFFVSDNVLCTKGFILSSVQILSNTLDTTSFFTYWVQLNSVLDHIGSPAPRPYSQEYEELPARWLLTQVQETPELAIELACLLSFQLETAWGNPEGMHYRLFEAIEASISSGRSILDGRRLAYLQHQFIALVPASTEAGDLVCRIKGYEVPLIFRKIGKSEEARGDGMVLNVNLIGECMVD